MSKALNSLTPQIISDAVERVRISRGVTNGRITDPQVPRLMQMLETVEGFQSMTLGLTQAFYLAINAGQNLEGTISLLIGTGFQVGFNAAMAIKTNDREVSELEHMVGLANPKQSKKRARKRPA